VFLRIRRRLHLDEPGAADSTEEFLDNLDDGLGR
jgi:hypothetical protein